MKKVTYSYSVLRNKKVKLIAALLLGIGLTSMQAQEAVPAGGGNATGTGGTLSYTVGEVFYTTNTGTSGTAAQGVQQPYEISVVTGIKEAKDISLEFTIYPNPATNFIKLKIGNYEIGNLRYQLYDINGTLLQDNKVEGKETSIVVGNLVPGTYFLKIADRNKEVKTFIIIKN